MIDLSRLVRRRRHANSNSSVELDLGSEDAGSASTDDEGPVEFTSDDMYNYFIVRRHHPSTVPVYDIDVRVRSRGREWEGIQSLPPGNRKKTIKTTQLVLQTSPHAYPLLLRFSSYKYPIIFPLSFRFVV